MSGVLKGRLIDDVRVGRFLDFILFDDVSDCWIFSGAKDGCGYGFFNIGSVGKITRSEKAHRFMFWLTRGYLPEHKEIAHLCDTRECVNPAHLKDISHYDNMQDCKAKGRLYDRRGEQNPRARLTWRCKKAIKLLHQSGRYSYSKLAQLFKLPKATIACTVTRPNWEES